MLHTNKAPDVKLKTLKREENHESRDARNFILSLMQHDVEALMVFVSVGFLHSFSLRLQCVCADSYLESGNKFQSEAQACKPIRFSTQVLNYCVTIHR